MRKSLAAIAGLVLVLGACTTAGSTDTTALEAAPEPVVAAAPETTTTLAPTTTEAPATTTVAAPTTTAPAPATTVTAPKVLVTTTTVAAEPEPVLTETAALDSMTVTMNAPQTGEGPIAIFVADPGDLPITVTLTATAVPDPRFGELFWWTGFGGLLFGNGNPNVQMFDLTIPNGQQSNLYSILARANGGDPASTTGDVIDILLTFNSDLSP